MNSKMKEKDIKLDNSMPVNRWFDHFRKRFGLKNVKIPSKLNKTLKKMEQNKTAASRYRQKKRAGQESPTGECKDLEKKNEVLKEKADSLAKEIQYLKDLIEEVRKAREKKWVPQLG
ncbi:unnamed protein product [Rangifer tarandus platyrhynchus]|uniref:Uncharacterized protein n=2 Tax=Rangifer tarandus platyrhynchus TaxID=3082113 RepID=A0ACB0FBN0_RANTA|nr:unnamed protein product [Rangifer tarandus platyrhynchus]CAI9709893.1 unnamed protein product [Rangifer tarandus platyrhynchus]